MVTPGHRITVLFNRLRDLFNLTMTYRRDSDIPWLYGWLEDKMGGDGLVAAWRNYSRMDDSRLDRYKRNKTKLVAWVVSHCSTNSRYVVLVLICTLPFLSL